MALIKAIVQISLFFVFFVFLFSCTDTSTPTSPTVDHIAPAVEWVHPQANGELSGIVELRFRVSDEGGIDSARVYLDGYSPDGWQIPDVTSELQVIYWNTLESDDGVHILEAHAWDQAGNLGTSPSLRVIVRNGVPPSEDRTPPDLWWIAPEAGSTLTDTVRLWIRFFDESGVDSIVLLKDGGLAASLPPAPRGGTEGGVEYLWDTQQDSDGVHVWEARAWDAAGNTGVSAGLLVRVQNHETPAEDHTPPVIVWRSPTPGDTLQGRIELRFDVMDDVGVDSVGLIVNGRSPATFILLAQQEVSFSFEWNSNNFEDGAYLIEIRAWDASGNIGFGSPISFRIWNNRPRVIWVPDEYETIQDAIWESRNGDAIMVRMGDYHEQLQFFDKSVSLISESGPEETTIDGTGYYTGAWVTGGQDTTMLIRGFTFRNDSEFMCYGAVFDGGASPKIVNNIFTSSFLDENRGINMGQNAAIIRNNLFINLYTSVEIAHSWGDLTNNMFLAVRSCLFNKAINGQLLVPDYNLFWDYEILIWSVGWGAHNIVDQEPLFEEGGFRLRPDSPGVNDGRPDISDLDNSCSDIGIYGGPYAYLP